MIDIFAKIFFAHMFGDYMFQPREMALKKSERSIQGLTWCTAHSLIYTACFALFFWTINPLFLTLVFLSHWPVDRWSLGQKWLNMIGGRNLTLAFSKTENKEVEIFFAGLVYVAVDNTMHLFLVWIFAKIFF
jgi:hypothetical protein